MEIMARVFCATGDFLERKKENLGKFFRSAVVLFMSNWISWEEGECLCTWCGECMCVCFAALFYRAMIP